MKIGTRVSQTLRLVTYLCALGQMKDFTDKMGGGSPHFMTFIFLESGGKSSDKGRKGKGFRRVLE